MTLELKVSPGWTDGQGSGKTASGEGVIADLLYSQQCHHASRHPGPYSMVNARESSHNTTMLGLTAAGTPGAVLLDLKIKEASV
jgi:hypothetical protein